MSTHRIGAPNWAEPLWVALSLGGWGSTSTLANLLDPDFGLPAQSTDATTANTQFAGDFSALNTILGGNPPGFDGFMIPKHNLTQSATIRVKFGTAAFTSGGAGGGTIVYDTGVVAALPAIVYTAGLLPWGHINTWTGAPDPIVDKSYNAPVSILFPSTVAAKFFWVGINDTANPDGYVSLSRLFLGAFWTPSKNFDYGVTIRLAGTRVANESVNNAEFIDPNRRQKRVVSFTLTDIPIDEATQVFFGLLAYLGYAKQGVFIFDPADTKNQGRTSFMFTVLQPGDFAYQNYGTENVPMQLQEVI